MYVVIVNYNNWQDSIECLSNLIKYYSESCSILLVDNDSTNDSVANLTAYLKGEDISELSPFDFYAKTTKYNNPLSFQIIDAEGFEILASSDDNRDDNGLPKILFFLSKVNLGFAGGNNIALQYILNENKESRISNESKVFLLNPDTVLAKGALQKLEEINLSYFVAACQIKDYNNPEKEGHMGLCKLIKPIGKTVNTNHISDADYIYGGALLTNVATLRKNGLLPEKYFLYWEEVDWCHRAKQNNIPFVTCKEAVVYDKVGGSTGRGELAHYYYIRNGLFFYKLYYKRYFPILFLVNIGRVIFLLLSGKFAKANGAFLGISDFLKCRLSHRQFN